MPNCGGIRNARPRQPGASNAASLRAALRLVRDATRTAGPTEAARQTAYELSPAGQGFRLTVLTLLAAQAARGQPELPTVAAVERELARLDRLPADLAREARPRRWRLPRRDPLPVEAARAAPLDQLAERLGLEVVRRGRVTLATCPFHSDQRPSLNLDLKRGLWFCFPCGRGGDGINLLMQLRGLTFADAVRQVVA